MIQAAIGGHEYISLNEKVLTSVEFSLITPEDSNARFVDQYAQLTLTGKITPAPVGAEEELILSLEHWAAVSDDRAEAYRPLMARVIESGVVLREYKLSDAYVVNYQVDYNDMEGNGTFILQVRQRKDRTKNVAVEGGYAS